MDCNLLNTTSHTCLARLKLIGKISKFQSKNYKWNTTRLGSQNSCKLNQARVGRYPLKKVTWKLYYGPVSLEDNFSAMEANNISKDQEFNSKEAFELPDSDQLKTLLVDTERSKLIKKLSDANQQNRSLKRQLQVKEDALITFKKEIAVIELEIQALVTLAEEITKIGVPQGSRKINGKYIQSHLFSRLQNVQGRLKEQIKDVDAAQSKEVTLFWRGMAESVQVMGSFDGWSQGEDLSPEYSGSYTTFSTTLMLPRGRYEIKFIIDGEWRILPEYPTVGEGLTKNNLLIVE